MDCQCWQVTSGRQLFHLFGETNPTRFQSSEYEFDLIIAENRSQEMCC